MQRLFGPRKYTSNLLDLLEITLDDIETLERTSRDTIGPHLELIDLDQGKRWLQQINSGDKYEDTAKPHSFDEEILITLKYGSGDNVGPRRHRQGNQGCGQITLTLLVYSTYIWTCGWKHYPHKCSTIG